MSDQPLRVAVVGHTNTGKTSLMRTLMRDVDFGDVSDRPAVTRHVEAAVLQAGGRPALELYDTPGLEDSIGLLELLDERRGERRLDGLEVVRAFLDSEDAGGRFAQEAKALRQVVRSDVALYVIDAREHVRGKHRDELEILGRCARPVVPVLNFTADAGARTAEWREHLARVNMHAVAEFDTVVYDARDEGRLFEKMRTLLDARGDALARLAADRLEQRRALVRSAAILLAEMLVDVAAFAERGPAGRSGKGTAGGAGGARGAGGVGGSGGAADAASIEALRQAVRDREQGCVDALLALFRFRPGDVEGGDLPIEGGVWGFDLFSAAALKQFGYQAGGAAATGAMVGLTFDIMLAGLSLGTGAAAGAVIGGLAGAARAHGRRLVDRARGYTELRCDERTLGLLLSRQLALVGALLRRGHASMEAVRIDGADSSGVSAADGARSGGRVRSMPKDVRRLLAHAQVFPRWSRLAAAEAGVATADPARRETVDRLAATLHDLLADDDGPDATE